VAVWLHCHILIDIEQIGDEDFWLIVEYLAEYEESTPSVRDVEGCHYYGTNAAIELDVNIAEVDDPLDFAKAFVIEIIDMMEAPHAIAGATSNAEDAHDWLHEGRLPT
jgi:hypothetical protein